MSRLPNITIGVAVLAVGGCSFVFSEAPPADRTTRPFLTCGESYAPPVVDTVFASLSGLVLATAKRPSNQTADEFQGAMTFWAVWLAVDAASAAYGYTVVTKCRDAKQAREVEMARASILPPPYGVGLRGAPPRSWPPRWPGPTPSPAPAPTPVEPPPEEPSVVPLPTP